MRICDLCAQSKHGYNKWMVSVQYLHAILVTKCVPHALYANSRVCVKTKVYFALNGTLFANVSSEVIFFPAVESGFFKNYQEYRLNKCHILGCECENKLMMEVGFFGTELWYLVSGTSASKQQS